MTPDGKNHHWSGSISRQIQQDGKTILLRHCSLCGRDFALRMDGSNWRAVYIGVFRIKPLADPVNQRWLEEECPKERLPEDDIARSDQSVPRRTTLE